MLKSHASNRGFPVAEPQEQVAGQPHPKSTRERRRRFVSERGQFEISANPAITTPSSRGTPDRPQILEIFEHSGLAEKYGEGPVQEKILEMAEALSGGIISTRLFAQEVSPNGMHLSHVWFGPNFPLFRHSHPRFGDCLYYVVAGEISLGRRKLRAGSVIFLPSGMPYKFKAGPAGAEVLEFRAGGGDESAPPVRLEEHSLDSIQQLIDEGKAHRHEWKAPQRIGDTALRQAEVDGRAE